MDKQKEIIGRIVAGTATDEEREQLQHIGAELVKSMIRPTMADLLKQQGKRNVLRPAKTGGKNENR